MSYQKYYHTVYEVFYFCAEHMLSIQSPFSFFVLIPSRTFKSISIGCTDDGFNSIWTFQMCSEVILFTYMFVCVCVSVKVFRRFHMCSEISVSNLFSPHFFGSLCLSRLLAIMQNSKQKFSPAEIEMKLQAIYSNVHINDSNCNDTVNLMNCTADLDCSFFHRRSFFFPKR